MKIGLGLFLGFAATLGGCASREDVVRGEFQRWIGRGVEDYVRERVEAPSQAVDVRDGGRLFLFVVGGCRRSVLGKPDGRGGYTIVEINANC